MSAERHCKDTTGGGLEREREERGVREKGRGDENDASERRSVDGIKKDAAVNTRVMHSRKRGPEGSSLSIYLSVYRRAATVLHSDAGFCSASRREFGEEDVRASGSCRRKEGRKFREWLALPGNWGTGFERA